jgi:hypothetical protein
MYGLNDGYIKKYTIPYENINKKWHIKIDKNAFQPLKNIWHDSDQQSFILFPLSILCFVSQISLILISCSHHEGDKAYSAWSSKERSSSPNV